MKIKIIESQNPNTVLEYAAHLDEQQLTVTHANLPHKAYISRIAGSTGLHGILLLIDNCPVQAYYYWQAGKLRLTIHGHSYEFERHFSLTQPLNPIHDHEHIVRSFMPGKIIKTMINSGDQVTLGQSLLIVEAMKMENEIHSPIQGKVVDIYVKQGQLIEANMPLVKVVKS